MLSFKEIESEPEIVKAKIARAFEVTDKARNSLNVVFGNSSKPLSKDEMMKVLPSACIEGSVVNSGLKSAEK